MNLLRSKKLQLSNLKVSFFFKNHKKTPKFSSKLYDHSTFYDAFIADLETCEKELIIETPSITTHRMYQLIPIFKKLIEKGVRVYIFTKKPKYLPKKVQPQATTAIKWFEDEGIQVFSSDKFNNRRLIFIDRKILYEGSLEPLAQEKSLEFMRRIEDTKTVKDTIKFLRYYVCIEK